jgi:hypothetical protein
MADSKVQDLTSRTPVPDDILYFVDDPDGTPLDGKCTFRDIKQMDGAPPGFIDVRDYGVTLDNPNGQRDELQDAMEAARVDAHIQGIWIPPDTIHIERPLLHQHNIIIKSAGGRIKAHSSFDFTQTITEAVSELSTRDSKSYTQGGAPPADETVGMLIGTNVLNIHGLGRYKIDNLNIDGADITGSKCASYTLQQPGWFRNVRFDDFEYGALFLEAGQEHSFFNTMCVGTSVGSGARFGIVMRGGTKFMTFHGKTNFEKIGGTAISSGSGGASSIQFDFIHHEANGTDYPNAVLISGNYAASAILGGWSSMDVATQTVWLNESSTQNGMSIQNFFINNQDGLVRFYKSTVTGHEVSGGIGSNSLPAGVDWAYQRQIGEFRVSHSDQSFPNHGALRTWVTKQGSYVMEGAGIDSDPLISIHPGSTRTGPQMIWYNKSGTAVLRVNDNGVLQSSANGTTWTDVPLS